MAGSLVVSLVAFTLLLKATTAFVDLDPRVWAIASGALVVLLGLSMLFPDAWARLATRTGLDSASHSLLSGAQRQRSGTLQAVGIGAALGPVFSSCSPTYAWVIATVLPARPAEAMLYLSLYCIGLAGLLLAIALAGRSLIARLSWAANPRGWFQRGVAGLMVVVGLLVATGLDQRFQVFAADKVPDPVAVAERNLLDLQQSQGADVADGAQAPELTGIQEWINSEPLTLKSLRGKVVLIDFWTYSCINCIRTQPSLNRWYEQYHGQGLEIIGVHAPEFAFEKVPDNVRRAVSDAGIRYPVALDNDFATWGAYQNKYWPAKYLVDRGGRIRYTHVGEGAYDEMDQRIRELVGAGPVAGAQTSQESDDAAPQTPETYLGVGRAEHFTASTPLTPGTHDYTPATSLPVDGWSLGGRWEVGDERIRAAADGARLTLRFRGRQVYLVADGRRDAERHRPGRREPARGDVRVGGRRERLW